MNVGDKVCVVKLPVDLPENNEALHKLFKGCVGKEFSIVAFDDDLAELHVGEAFGEPSEKHRIWLPREYLKKVVL